MTQIDIFNIISSLTGHLIAVAALIISILTMTSAKQIKEQINELKKATVKKYEFTTKKERLIKLVKKYIDAIEKDVFGYQTISQIIVTLKEIKYLSSQWDGNDKKTIDELIETLSMWCKDVSTLKFHTETKKRYCINGLGDIYAIINKGVYSI